MEMYDNTTDAEDYYQCMKNYEKPLENELKILLYCLKTNYNQHHKENIFGVAEEAARMTSGYYININEGLNMLKNNSDGPGNPFQEMENNFLEYIQFLQNKATVAQNNQQENREKMKINKRKGATVENEVLNKAKKDFIVSENNNILTSNRQKSRNVFTSQEFQVAETLCHLNKLRTEHKKLLYNLEKQYRETIFDENGAIEFFVLSNGDFCYNNKDELLNNEIISKEVFSKLLIDQKSEVKSLDHILI